MRVDAIASVPWYLDHLAPIWRALPPDRRGRIHLGPRCAGRRIVGATDEPIGRGTDAVIAVGHGDLLKARRVGRTLLALGQHGAGQSYSSRHKSFPGGEDQDDVGLFLVPNEHAAARTRQFYPDARVALIGCPKLDHLPARARRKAGDRPVVAISFHWDGSTVAPELKPGWRFYRLILANLRRELPEFEILGHAHPKAMHLMAPFYRRAGIEVVSSFEEVLRRADIYAVDNSSTLFEFASTGRGVVVLNTPLMRRHKEHGLRFWEAATVGVQVDRPRHLAAAIRRAWADPPEVAAAREAALDIVYTPRHGGAEVAAAAILEWLDASPEQVLAPLPEPPARSEPPRVPAYLPVVH